MKSVGFTILIIIMLLGAFKWNWTKFEHIDHSNAVQMCPKFHNVKCPILDPFFEDEPRVIDGLGDNITDHCPERTNPKAVEWGCYSINRNIAFIRETLEDDAGHTLGHERCHWLCGVEHVTEQEYDITKNFELLDK